MASAMDASENAFNQKSQRIAELNVMKYGTATIPEEKIEKKVIVRQLGELVKNAGSGIYDKVKLLAQALTKDEYTDVYEALYEIESNLLLARTEAYIAVNEQAQKDLFRQNENASVYEAAAHTGMLIDEAADKKLKKLAIKAGDRTLSIAERKSAEKEYDDLYSATVENEAELEARLKKLADLTYGKGSYNSETLYDGILAHHADYTNLENRMNFLVDENRMEESYYKNAIKSYMEIEAGYEDEKNARLVASYKAELEESLKRLTGEKLNVIKELEDTALAAITQWNKAEGKIRVQYNTWKRNFLKEYREKTAEWNENYEGFIADKQNCMNAMYLAGSGSLETEKNGVRVEEAVTRAVSKAGLTEKMETSGVNSSGIVADTLSLTNLEQLMQNFTGLEKCMNEKDMAVLARKSAAGNGRTGISDIAKANLAVKNVEKQLEENAALLAAYSVKEYLIEAGKNIAERIKQNNDGMAGWEEDIVLNAGYTYSRNRIHRNAVTGATVLGIHYSEQEVHPYQDFSASVPVVSIDVDGLTGLGSSAIMLALNQIKRELSDFEKSVFGEQIETKSKDAEEEKALEKKKARFEELKAAGYENLNVKRQDEYNQLAAALYTTEGGRFAEHTGKAPVWIDNRDPSRSREHNIKVSGSGEIGEIMLDFEWNDMKEKQGWGEIALPMYEKRIWDGAEAPSIREVADIATSVAAGVAGTVASIVGTPVAGAAIATAIELQTKAVFAGLDYGLGYKSKWEVGNELGKEAAVSALTNFGSAGISTLSQSAKISTTLGKVAVSTGGSAAMTTGRTAIQNFDFNGDFNTSSFLNTMGTFDTWKGTISTGAGAAVTAGLDRAILGEGVKNVDGNILSYAKTQGFSSANNASIQKLTSFAGNLANAGLSYALTGTTTFNVLDVADLGLSVNGQKVHTGLLEWTIGGDNAGLHLGTGGTNISYGTIGGALKGLSTVSVNSRINSYTKQNNLENLAVGMRMQYGYGGNAENTLLQDVLSGTTKISLDGTDGNAETVEKNGIKTVHISGYDKNMTLEEQFDLGIKLSHESYRNGIDDGSIGQILETGTAVIGHSALAQNILDDGIYKTVMDGVIAGSTTLGSDLEHLAKLRNGNLTDEEKLAYLQYVNKNYDSSKDYWLVKMDGTIEKTKEKAFFREVINENGETVTEKIKDSDYTGSDELALIKAVGGLKNFLSMNIDLKNGIYKIANLGENDSLGVARSEDGKYTFFTAGLDFIREGNALKVYDGWSIDRNNYTREDYAKVENTVATFWMKDAFSGNDISRETFTNAFTSVDNTNNPNQSLVSEYFKMYFTETKNKELSDSRYNQFGTRTVGVFNGAETMEGRVLDILGKDRLGAKPTLYHPMSQFAGSENCFGPMSDYNVGNFKSLSPADNIYGYTGAYYFNQQLKLYNSLGIYNGYQFNIHLKGKLLQ